MVALICVAKPVAAVFSCVLNCSVSFIGLIDKLWLQEDHAYNRWQAQVCIVLTWLASTCHSHTLGCCSADILCTWHRAEHRIMLSSVCCAVVCPY